MFSCIYIFDTIFVEPVLEDCIWCREANRVYDYVNVSNLFTGNMENIGNFGGILVNIGI